METAKNANQKVRLTKSRVDGALCPETGQLFIRDTDLKGFGLRLTPGSKAFIVEKRVDKNVRRMTLGKYPEITVEQARKEAHKILGQIATGGNPIAEKAQHELEATTLEQTFQDFLAARKNLKPKTIYDYGRLMEVAFGDWKDRALVKISKDMVAKRHSRIGEQRGEAYANLAMRFLRGLFNFAIAQYEGPDGVPLIPENPVSRLTQTRAWYRVDRRQTVIKPHQLAAWYQAVDASRHDARSRQAGTIADYLLFLMFTGMRREEGARLTWNRVDLKQKTLLIQDTKNREPLTLPLSDFLVGLLTTRRAESVSEYVFPSEGARGYLQEPRKQMHHIMVASGVEFTLHDLRRTFITLAESLDISAYALKRLVNHKMSGDVTAGYIVADVERLREPMNRISAALLHHAGVKPRVPGEKEPHATLV
jgi:integrase